MSANSRSSRKRVSRGALNVLPVVSRSIITAEGSEGAEERQGGRKGKCGREIRKSAMHRSFEEFSCSDTLFKKVNIAINKKLL